MSAVGQGNAETVRVLLTDSRVDPTMINLEGVRST